VHVAFANLYGWIVATRADVTTIDGDRGWITRVMSQQSPGKRRTRKIVTTFRLSDLPGVTVKVLRSTADLYGEIRFNLHLAPRTIIDM